MTIIRVGLDTSKHVFQIHGVTRTSSRCCGARSGAARWQILRQAGADADRPRGVRGLALLGAGAARPGTRGDAGAAAIYQALRQARQE